MKLGLSDSSSCPSLPGQHFPKHAWSEESPGAWSMRGLGVSPTPNGSDLETQAQESAFSNKYHWGKCENHCPHTKVEPDELPTSILSWLHKSLIQKRHSCWGGEWKPSPKPGDMPPLPSLADSAPKGQAEHCIPRAPPLWRTHPLPPLKEWAETAPQAGIHPCHFTLLSLGQACRGAEGLEQLKRPGTHGASSARGWQTKHSPPKAGLEGG